MFFIEKIDRLAKDSILKLPYSTASVYLQLPFVFIFIFIQFKAIKSNQKQHNDKRQYS